MKMSVKRTKLLSLIFVFLLFVKPTLIWASASHSNKTTKKEHWHKVVELRGTNSLKTKVYRFKPGKLRLKYQFQGSSLSSSVAIRAIPVKPANAKEVIIYNTGNASQTVALKYTEYYFIISSMDSLWRLKIERKKAGGD